MSPIPVVKWVGSDETRADWITPARVAAWNATFDRDLVLPSEGSPAPLGFHWTLSQPAARESDLGDDGHARTGGFLPPVKLPRRMWAGSRVVFHKPLLVGEHVDRQSVVAAINEKQGEHGPLVFVTVRHQLSGSNGLAIEEEQDLVYREAPKPGATVATSPIEAVSAAAWRQTIEPTATLLFRYSALTFNGHRIHYDRRYVEQVEGYPGLVVHGPLIATLLLNLLQARLPDATVARFNFKARRPTFDISPFSVYGSATDHLDHYRLWSTNNRAETAVEAEAWIR
ncbi:MAG: MaoC family dehydratase N-terminal domain-containing protein [bacterium]